MIAVRLTDVVKEWTSGPTPVRAVRGVSLEVRRGEKLVLLGKSGSGKSTLLHLVGGLDRPSAGRIEIEGRERFNGVKVMQVPLQEALKNPEDIFHKIQH